MKIPQTSQQLTRKTRFKMFMKAFHLTNLLILLFLWLAYLPILIILTVRTVRVNLCLSNLPKLLKYKVARPKLSQKDLPLSGCGSVSPVRMTATGSAHSSRFIRPYLCLSRHSQRPAVNSHHPICNYPQCACAEHT